MCVPDARPFAAIANYVVRFPLRDGTWTRIPKLLLARDPLCWRIRIGGTSSVRAPEFRHDSASPLSTLDKVGVKHNDVRQSDSACTFHMRVRSRAEVGLWARTQEH